jgi:hypothetical protein
MKIANYEAPYYVISPLSFVISTLLDPALYPQTPLQCTYQPSLSEAVNCYCDVTREGG